MRKKVIITHYDRGIDPQSATISGKTDKELIYSLIQRTGEWPISVLGEEHPLIVATFDGDIPVEEAVPLINFETLDEFKEFVETKTGYRLHIS